MKLSIVIPVYNKEVWLRPLFESLMGQGLDKEDYEIIFVNDGSTDGSDAVCRDLISAHPEVNVKYRTQANAGVSAARNAGIDMAAGEYIHFLDCDDYMLDGSYGYLLEKWGDEGLDYIGFWPIWLEMRNGVDPSAEAAGLTVSGDEKERVSGLRLVADGRWPSSSVAGLYRREFLKSRGVAFPVGVIVGEDLMFNSDFFIRSPRCVLTSCLPYVYRVHSSSTMNTISAEKAEKWFFSYYTTLKHLVDYKQNTPPRAILHFLGGPGAGPGKHCQPPSWRVHTQGAPVQPFFRQLPPVGAEVRQGRDCSRCFERPVGARSKLRFPSPSRISPPLVDMRKHLLPLPVSLRS